MNKASFLCKGFVALLVMMCTTTRLVWAEPVAEQQVEVQEAIEPLAILSKVDAKADAVVVIPSLRQLSDKVLILGKQLGVAQLPPDPLMMLKAMSGIMMGVDDQANVAVVVSKLDNALAQPFAAPNVAVLLPVTTVDQFMGNFEGRAQKLDNGLTEVMMPGSPVYVKSLGEKYVAMSDSQATLASYKAANADQWTQAQGTVATDYLSKGDLIVMFNPKTLATMLNDNMARIRTTMKVELDKQQEEDPALVAFRPMIEFYYDLFLNASQTLLNDTTGMTMGLTITDAGISNGMSIQFAKDSNLHAIFADAPQAMGDFQLLPQLPWISIARFQGKHLDQQLILSLAKQLIPPKEIVPEAGQEAVALFASILDNYMLYDYPYEQMKVSNAAGLTQMVTAIDSGDQSKAVFEKIRSIIKPTVELFNSLMANVPQEGMGKFAMSYKENAQDIKGALATDYMSFPATGEMGMALQQTFGAPSVDIRFSYNDSGVVSVVGEELMLNQALAAVAEKPVIEQTKTMTDAMRPNLPANRFMESYLSLPKYIQQIQAAMLKQPQGMQIGMMIGMLQLPAELEPIATTASNIDGGMRMDSFVPSQTITAVAEKAMMLFQMFNGMQQGPGGAAQQEPQPNQVY